MYKVELRDRLRSLSNPYPQPFPRKQGKGEGRVQSLPACGEEPQGGVDPLFKWPLMLSGYLLVIAVTVLVIVLVIVVWLVL